MRAEFAMDGAIVLIPEGSGDARALMSWDAMYPQKSIHEGMEFPMKMRPSAAVRTMNQTMCRCGNEISGFCPGPNVCVKNLDRLEA